MRKARRLITQGHRGARGVLPENTLASMAYAIDAGVDRIEIDINLTADDALIVFHDESTHPDIVRDASGAWISDRVPWRTLDSATIRRFDVGRIRPETRYAERFASQTPIDGARIPFLGEVIDLLREKGRGDINLEVKCDPGAPGPRPEIPHYAEQVVAAIDRANFRDRVTVQSFNWRMVAALRELDPSLSAGCLTSEHREFDTVLRGADSPSPWTNGLRIEDFGGSLPAMVKAMEVGYWAAQEGDIDPASVDEAHALGLEVHAWTVNEPESMKKLISWGIDSIISDYPDTLLEATGSENE